MELSPITVGVFGSGTQPHEALSRDVGHALAALGVNLLTGGGGGVMTSVSEAFTRAHRTRGVCIGIIPCESEDARGTPKRGYPNPFVELAIQTHLPLSGERGTDDLSRNHINVLSCVASVALPGEAGTAAEVALAVRYGRPVIAYSHDFSLISHFSDAVARVDTINQVTRFLEAHFAR